MTRAGISGGSAPLKRSAPRTLVLYASRRFSRAGDARIINYAASRTRFTQAGGLGPARCCLRGLQALDQEANVTKGPFVPVS